jgi:hypothetical protein
MRIYINVGSKNAKFKSWEILSEFPLHSLQLDSVYVCPSILGSFNALGSPMLNRIEVQPHRKVHRELSLMYYNR